MAALSNLSSRPSFENTSLTHRSSMHASAAVSDISEQMSSLVSHDFFRFLMAAESLAEISNSFSTLCFISGKTDTVLLSLTTFVKASNGFKNRTSSCSRSFLSESTYSSRFPICFSKFCAGFYSFSKESSISNARYIPPGKCLLAYISNTK